MRPVLSRGLRVVLAVAVVLVFSLFYAGLRDGPVDVTAEEPGAHQPSEIGDAPAAAAKNVDIDSDCAAWVAQHGVPLGHSETWKGKRSPASVVSKSDMAMYADPVLNAPSTDVDLGAWCPVVEYNAQTAVAARATAEIIALLTEIKPRVCAWVDSNVRMGYNITLLMVDPPWQWLYKIRYVKQYMRMERARVLQQLGFPPRKAPANGAWNWAAIDALDEPTAEEAAALTRHLDRREHVYVGLDAFDTRPQLSPRELHRKLARHFPDYHYVVSGEANLWGLPKREYFPNWKTHMFPYPNTGIWLGRLDDIIAFMALANVSTVADEGCAYLRGGDEDQCRAQGAMVENNFTTYVCDSENFIGQSMYPGEQSGGVFTAEKYLNITTMGLLKRIDIDNTPVFVHWMGPAKAGWYYSNERQLAVNFGNYEDRFGWRRRPLMDGSDPLVFSLTYQQLKDHITMYNPRMERVEDPAAIFMDACLPA